MSDLLDEVKSLRSDIDNLPEVQEYYRLKETYEKDEELQRMRMEIARLKSLGKEEERNNLLEIYNQHPLVVNYEVYKEEVEDLLRQIKNIIQ